MTVKAKSGEPSLQDCLNILYEALKIVSKGSKGYYVKNASEVTEGTLKAVGKSLVPVSILLKEFVFCWMASRHRGPDAIMSSKKLDDRIDIKLLRTGKLDFGQFRKIATRLNRVDDALGALSRIDFYISHYRQLCKEKGLDKQVEHVKLLTYAVLSRATEIVKSDAERLTKQIERCSLYYQSKQAQSSVTIQKSQARLTKVSILIATVALIATTFIGASSIYIANIDYQRTHPNGVYYINIDFLGYDEPINADHFRITITYYGSGESRFLRISVGIVGVNPTVISKGNVEVMEPNIILARNYVDGLIGWVDYNIERFASINRTELNILDFNSDVNVELIDNT